MGIRARLRLAVVLVVVLTAMLVPARAMADVADTYRDWGYVESGDISGWAHAYRWYSGYGWYDIWRQDDQRVWIQPFATGWMWTWSTDRGWLAMRSTDLRSTATVANTWVYGNVQYGPLCPLEPCSQVQPKITLTFTNTTTKRAYTTTTGYFGDYQLLLLPGSYRVTASVGIGWSDTAVVSATDTYARFDFDIDSGIR